MFEKVGSDRPVLHKMQHVLVADDSAIARDVILRGINAHKNERYCQIHVAENGAKALKIFKKWQIDVAFVDIHMPGLTGPELVASLRDTPSKDCLTIAVSTQLDTSSENVLKEYGAYHFMQKPFSSSDVAAVYLTYIVMTKLYRIFVVDDSATMRKLARRILERSRFAFEIVEAESAEQTARILKSGLPDIVLTDFHMPDIDGLELAGAIRSASEKIGIYMMSTTDTTYLERSAAFIGITGFLKKPFTPADIDTLMHDFLGLDSPTFGKTREMFSFLERSEPERLMI